MQNCLQVKFVAALLEQIFQTLPKQIHYHHMKHLSVVCLFVAYEVEKGNKSFAAQLVNEFALPEKHDMFLHFHCFFLKKVLKRLVQNKAGKMQPCYVTSKMAWCLPLVVRLLILKYGRVEFRQLTLHFKRLLTTLAARSSPVFFFSTKFL